MAKPEKVEPNKTVEPTFSLDRLRQDCRTLFGVTESTFDGATHGRTGEYAVQAVRDIINLWLNTPITQQGGAEHGRRNV